MPHIIVEYTVDVIAAEKRTLLLDALYQVVEDCGLFDTENIKLRVIPIQDYRLGLNAQGFIHVQCRIHAGRSDEQKKSLSTAIVNKIEGLNVPVSVATCEVVEMDRSSYSKSVALNNDL